MIMLPLVLPLADFSATVSYAFSTSDWLAKGIVVLLLVGSVAAWAVMVFKIMDCSRAMEDGRRFLAAYRREKNPLMLFAQKRNYAGPLAAIYQQTCGAIGSDLPAPGDAPELFVGKLDAERKFKLSRDDFHNAARMAGRIVADQSTALESNMGFLVTVVAVAPFLGVLGAAWGILDCFSSLAESGTVSLVYMAPGIAGALFSLVISLFVGLPSLIGYSLLKFQIQRLRRGMEKFAEELLKDLERNFLGAG